MSEYASVKEVADYFGVSAFAVRDWIQRGKIPEGSCIKLGGKYRLKIKMIEQWAIDQHLATESGKKLSSNEVQVSPNAEDVEISSSINSQADDNLHDPSPEQLVLDFGDDEENGEFL